MASHDRPRIPHRLTGARFIRAVRVFGASQEGWKARGMFAALIAFLFAINGTNVVNSYVGRDFMTAIADRDQTTFIHQAILYLGVFAGATLLAVGSRFTEERLALLWRGFLTGRAVQLYLADGTYQRLEATSGLANPDQRITEDVRAFTTTTLSFVLMLLNSSFTVVAFSSVLWSISPRLLLVAVLYAAAGSVATVWLGRPLVRLNNDQLDREANFRSGLIHVRENAEAIRLSRAEPRLAADLQERLAALVDNFRHITSINRNLGFFTTGYSWLIQIIPALIIAPTFIAGEIEFGVITQSAMAFSTLVAAFSLIVTQFQSISSFAAVVGRLSSLVDAIEQAERPPLSGIEEGEEDGRLACERLTLLAPDDGRVLVRSLSLEARPGCAILIRGTDAATTLALLDTLAGLGSRGQGRLIRPRAEDIMFVGERPYLPPGTLRSALLQVGREAEVPDARLIGLLNAWNLGAVLTRAEGLDSEQEWPSRLSLGEQQLLACLRVLLAAPALVVLDRPGTTLGQERTATTLERFADAGIGHVRLGHTSDPPCPREAVLDIRADGHWAWTIAPPAGGGTPAATPTRRVCRIDMIFL